MPTLEKEVHTSKKRQLETPVDSPTPPPIQQSLGQDDANVGNKLLKMMGWKEGTGLGSEGAGRVNPMYVLVFIYIPFRSLILLKSETAVYTPGVGLGASKGKDLGKYAEGFSSYVHMAQDSVSLLFRCFVITHQVKHYPYTGS